MNVQARTAAAAVAVAGALMLAACGHTGDGRQPGGASPMPTQPPTVEAMDAVRAAAQATLASSADVSMRMAGAPALGGNASASGSVDFAWAEGAVTVTLGARAGTEQLFFLPNTLYIHQPGTPRANTTPWLLFVASEAGSAQADYTQMVLEAMAVDPIFTVSELAWGGVLTSPAGQSRVNGTTVTHYVVTVNLPHAALGATGPAATAYSLALNSQMGTFQDSAAAQVTMQVDVDPSGRLAGIVVTPPSAGVGTVTFTFAHYGAGVSVTPPLVEATTDIATIGAGAEQEKKPRADGDAS
jgi:hypothetical protein